MFKHTTVLAGGSLQKKSELHKRTQAAVDFGGYMQILDDASELQLRKMRARKLPDVRGLVLVYV